MSRPPADFASKGRSRSKFSPSAEPITHQETPTHADEVFGKDNRGSRTHLWLDKDAPEPRPVQPPDAGRVVAIPRIGGFHDRYERRAA
jgi:hypothetical protein